MAKWLSLPDITLTNGSKVVSVNDGTGLTDIEEGDALVYQNLFYEIESKTTTTITLADNWAGATAANVSAKVMATIASIAALYKQAVTRLNDTADVYDALEASGLGGESKLSVIDWNNLDESTLLNPVLSNNGSLNGPPSSEPYYYPQVMKYENANVMQIAWPYRVGIGGAWIRSRYDGVWTLWQPIYTGVNYQPTNSEGLNARLLLKNGRATEVGGGSIINGADLRVVKFDSSGNISSTGGSYSGQWRNMSGQSIQPNEFGIFVREE